MLYGIRLSQVGFRSAAIINDVIVLSLLSSRKIFYLVPWLVLPVTVYFAKHVDHPESVALAFASVDDRYYIPSSVYIKRNLQAIALAIYHCGPFELEFLEEPLFGDEVL